jgi:ribosome-associated protein
VSAEREPEPEPEQIAIRGESIRLGQLLKLAGIIDSGGEAREFLTHEAVLVNGEPESRRGRQLRPGDEIRAGARTLRLTGSQ